jgi:hypothetical protein
MAKKMTTADFFGKYNRSFMKFGELFVKKLTDEELVSALAEKDLEKLAKVFKLVFEMLGENNADDGAGKLIQLIGEYNDIAEESGESGE